MKNDQIQPPEANNPLDALLRDADEYIPDNGFSARVVKNLPARRHRRWCRFAVLSASLLIGVSLAAWQYPAIVVMFSGAWTQPASINWRLVLGLVPLIAALASLAWTVFAIVNDED